ncbi:hypothetical protein JCM11641_004514 [Rhodosporidiobolus odoratus]
MGLGEVLGFTKTATFNATVQVHELQHVPLLHARLRAKWKFNGATTLSAPDTPDDPPPSHHGFGKRFLHPRTALHHVPSPPPAPPAPQPADNGYPLLARSGSPGRWDSGDDDLPPSGFEGFRSPSRSPPLSPDVGRTPNPNRTPGPSSTSAFAFTSPFSANAETVYAHGRGGTTDTVGTEDALNAGSTRRRGGGDLNAVQSLPGLAASAAQAHRPEPKGSTTFIPLRQHTATFNREIICPVSIPLRSLPLSSSALSASHLSTSSSSASSSTAKFQLQPSPVRLSFKQEVLTEDGKREEEALGEVILDLSQFVGQKAEEAKPRRYLLQGCKSNAVLRVTVKMELVEGEASFIAPPLRSGQVSTSSSATKGVHGSQNCPMNRSTTSREFPSFSKSHPSTTSIPRLSTSTFSTSRTGSSNGRLARTNSVSSAGSSRSQSHSAASSREYLSQHLGMSRTASANTVNGARNGRQDGKKKKKRGWHPPCRAFIFSNLTSTSDKLTPSAIPSLSFNPSSGMHTTAPGERSAAEVIDSLFNRPLRTPSWVGFSAASRPPTPSVEQGGFGPPFTSGETLGEPFELDMGSGSAGAGREHGRMGKTNRKSGQPTLSVKTGGASLGGGGGSGDGEKRGKAWSIRSGIGKHKEKQREKKEEKRDKKEKEREREMRVERYAAVPVMEAPDLQVQPPTPQPALGNQGSFTFASRSATPWRSSTLPTRPSHPPPPLPPRPHHPPSNASYYPHSRS